MKGFYKLLEEFLLVYLPKERGYSKNTVLSYYTGIKLAIAFICQHTHKKQEEITVFDFTRESIGEFLLTLEKDGKSITTRNQRLAVITSYITYCSMIDSVYQNTLNEIKKIKSKKTVKNKMDFLTIEEYKDVISVVDLKNRNGLRYYTLINVLYDTAARVQELIDIDIIDINFGSRNSIRLKGKGNKYRLVYISDHTVKLIDDYRNKYNIKAGRLFLNKQDKPLTRFGVEYIISKHYELACKVSLTLKNKHVTPHTFRHSKACHLLINGVALTIIQKFLGHASVQTTEMYVDITSDVVFNAVQEASDMVYGDINTEIKQKWVEEPDLLNQIKQLFYS